jgi:hypothetical protein
MNGYIWLVMAYREALRRSEIRDKYGPICPDPATNVWAYLFTRFPSK